MSSNIRKQKKQFYVFSTSRWVADDIKELCNDEEWEVIYSYGLDVPYSLQEAYNTHEPLSYWMPAAFAAKMKKTAFPPTLTSPGTQLLSVLPAHLTHREVATLTLEDFLQHPISGEFFLKPAEAKLDYFPAQQTSWNELHWLMQPDKPELFPQDMVVQYTPNIMTINYEHRFYILNNEPVTGSAYLVDGVTFYDNDNNEKYQSRLNEAQSFVVEALKEFPDMPEGYVLDVAWNVDTANWFVLEANPAWCSGFYGSDIPLVMETIYASCNPTNLNHIWKTDSALQAKADRQPVLPYQTS